MDASDITIDMKFAAAYAIANFIEEKDLRPDYIIPGSLDHRVSIAVAQAVAEAAVLKGVSRIKDIDLDHIKRKIAQRINGQLAQPK